MQQVLQVSAKLSEGGAAGVARTLADELRSLGIRSPFAYGYGRRGRESHLEHQYDGVRITPGPIAALNRTNYGLMGRETRLQSRRRWEQLEQAVLQSDIVHLHILHSYFAETSQLFDLLERANKPVVWTLHDQWIMTGRCAQPAGCELWRSGCKSCPDLKAYPPARIDHAAARWSERRSALERLQNNVDIKFVACAEWLAEAARSSGLRDVRTITNSVDREFWTTARITKRFKSDLTRNLFICRDLRDPKKVAGAALSAIEALPNQTLTVMGDDPPADLRYTRHVPATGDRSTIARTMVEHDRLIFTSDVDYFPLTIAEALTAKLQVIALDSPAAREFARHPLLSIASSKAELLSQAKMPLPIASAGESDVMKFAPERMVRKYIGVYEELLERASS